MNFANYANCDPMSKLREARQRRGLTIVEVAKAIGRDPASVSRVERGVQTPGLDMARSLFEYYEGEVPIEACYDPGYQPVQGSADEHPAEAAVNQQ